MRCSTATVFYKIRTPHTSESRMSTQALHHRAWRTTYPLSATELEEARRRVHSATTTASNTYVKHTCTAGTFDIRQALAKLLVVDAIRHPLQQNVERPIQQASRGVHHLVGAGTARYGTAVSQCTNKTIVQGIDEIKKTRGRQQNKHQEINPSNQREKRASLTAQSITCGRRTSDGGKTPHSKRVNLAGMIRC